MVQKAGRFLINNAQTATLTSRDSGPNLPLIALPATFSPQERGEGRIAVTPATPSPSSCGER